MKFKLYTIIIALLAFCTSSCADLDLQPADKATAETWFTDDTQVQMALNTLYQHGYWPLHKTDWTNTTAIMSLDEPSDDWMNRTSVVPLINGTLNSDNSNAVKYTYRFTYRAIARAIEILNNIERSKDNISIEHYERYIGDARFVRACMYARLISRFGDVIYHPNGVSLEESYNTKRTDKEIILKDIYADFDYAAEKLPISYKGDEIQRATKGMAYAMKARTALFFHDYEIARDAAKACMDLGVYELYSDFAELFSTKTKNSIESVFCIPRSNQYGTAIHPNGSRPYLSRNIASPSSTASPSWDLFCAFLCTDGETIDKSSLYNPREPFKNRDPRCAYTVVEFNTNYLGFNYTPHPDSLQCWNYDLAKFVKNNDSKAVDQYASYNGLNLRKGIDQGWVEDAYYVSTDKIIMRYADVLLMYAEAKIELNEIDDTVLDAMNMVRARAYKDDYKTGTRYPKITETDQTSLRRILRIERRMEFAFEGLRYDDLIRWKIAETVLNRPNYGLPTSAANCRKLVSDGLWFMGGTPEIDENGCPDFSKMENISRYRSLSQRIFDPAKHYLWPIPSTEITALPDLENNPGY